MLSFQDKKVVITGVANKKSVAYHVAQDILSLGGDIILTVQTETHLAKAQKLFPDLDAGNFFIVDCEKDSDVENFGKVLNDRQIKVDGLLHSIAFANYSKGPVPFHETLWEDYQQANKISCYSLMSLSNALKNSFNPGSSVVTVSISNTKATNYGYMGPIKASLDSAVAFLAKSFSEFSDVRFNGICSGPLKTSASAGIPGYVDNYIFAEQLTLRKKALATKEVSQATIFLLSTMSSGINGTGLLIDAGMSVNYFDQAIVKSAVNNLES